jgi:RNA-directed DNA polymerase
MNVEQSMCAASGLASQWERINWSQCEQRVRRLQARIVKATQEGRQGKVKALQWLLTHSFHGRALAVKRVTHNKGKNTPGVDGAVWRSPAARYRAIDTLRRRG